MDAEIEVVVGAQIDDEVDDEDDTFGAIYKAMEGR